MTEDVALLHEGAEDLVEVQVRAADGGRRDADDRVVGLLDLGVRDIVDADVALAVPGDSFHRVPLPGGRRRNRLRRVPDVPAFTSPLAESLAGDVLERFLRYVRVDTQSARDQDATPSTQGQLVLSAMLEGELRELGLDDAEMDEQGYVFATLP